MRLRAGRADAANLRVLVFPKGRGGEKIAGEIRLLDGEAVTYARTVRLTSTSFTRGALKATSSYMPSI
jgi:hypothetical protein